MSHDKKRSAFDCTARRPTTKRRYVSCPCCSGSIAEDRINSHLDSCILQETRYRTTNSDSSSCRATRYDSSKSSTREMTSHGGNSRKLTLVDEPTPSDAFSHMMAQSRRQSQVKVERFHLYDDYSLIWTDDASVSPPESITWTSTIQLRKGNDGINTNLNLSSSIPERSSSSSVMLVENHSQLSVPVLKSILQKSIRRRRPLPATRVAMELADKAMGELLRRLPIIILEDSTLHPDFPLLCWLMAADSKNYRMPQALAAKVLQVVFEVASCPWTDHSPSLKERNCTDNNENILTALHHHYAVILKAMDMRASYGGMNGDMRMLENYRNCWTERFLQDKVPHYVQSRVGPAKTWLEVLNAIHSQARVAGLKHVPALVQTGLPCLELKDICVEGVDFHCSNVVGQLIADSKFVEESLDRLRRDGILTSSCGDIDLALILKRCMWNYSSAVNFRRLLVEDVPGEPRREDNQEQEALKAFWKGSVESRVKDFMTLYVGRRLATGSFHNEVLKNN